MKVLPLYLPHEGCTHQCIYCNQPLIVNTPDERGAWPSRLQSLLDRPATERWEIAFYGGSFSALPREAMQSYFKTIQPYLSAPRVAGIRISTRPDCVDDSMLGFLREQGVTTIELGGESFDDRVLRQIGRGHDARECREACERIQAHGFNLGLHLMCGLPGQTEDSWRSTVDETVKIKPDMVRFAPTLVIQGTPLEALYREGRYAPQSMDEAIYQCMIAYRAFYAHGIPIVRVGLALSDIRGDGKEKVVAGPWHPALRHEVESRLAMECILHKLYKSNCAGVIVNGKDLSITLGPKRRNCQTWKEKVGREITVGVDDSLPRYTFGLGPGQHDSLFVVEA